MSLYTKSLERKIYFLFLNLEENEKRKRKIVRKKNCKIYNIENVVCMLLLDYEK